MHAWWTLETTPQAGVFPIYGMMAVFLIVAGSANGGLAELGVPGRRARDALWAAKARLIYYGWQIGGLVKFGCEIESQID